MAITNADGSIILSTHVDTSGIKKGLGSLKKDTSSITQGFKSLAAAIGLAFSVTKLIQFSKESATFATQTEASIQRLIDIYGDASKEIGSFIDANALALGMSKASAASYASVYGNLFSVWADQSTNAQLTAHYLNATAVIASKTGRTMEDVQERIRSGLLGNTEAVEDLGIFVSVKTIEMTEAFQRVADGRSWEQLNNSEQSQVRTLAILEQATKNYGKEVSNTTALTRTRFNAAYEDFKNSWGQVVNVVLVPVLNFLTKIFSVATALINSYMGKTGDIADETEQIASNIGIATKKQKGLKDEVEKTEKALKKALAGFDDLQILTSSASSSAPDAGDGPFNDYLGELPEAGSGMGDFDPMAYAEKIKEAIATVLPDIKKGLVAIGLFLIACGNIPWGIGFIIAGAVLYSATEGESGELNFDNIITTIQSFFEEFDAIIAGVSLAVLMLGIILLCSGVFSGLSIGLIVKGAAGLAATITLTEGSVLEKIRNFINDNWGAIAAISGAFLIIGILLLWAGPTFFKMAIALIAAGAVGIATPIALNWDAIVNSIRTFLFENSTLLALISGGLLILGILVCIANPPLGIALIVAGAAGLVTITALNWDSIVEWVSGAWDAVKKFWDKYIAPIFTLEWWLELGKTCINGLIAGFEGGINFIISGFESMLNWLIEQFNKISFTVPDWVPGIGGNTVGVNLGYVEFGRVSIPRLAKGAVIPANREFLAVLGDQKQGVNIETPLDTMIEAFNTALDSRGDTVKEEHYYLSETELMSVLYKLVKGGERIQGTSLVSGGGY